MIKATVLSPWKTVAIEGGQAITIEVSDLMSVTGESCTDITEQAHPVPDPNLLACEIMVTQATLDKIKLDDKYFVLSEENV